MATLRHRMLEDLRIRNLSPRTQTTYVRHVQKYAEFFGRSPAELGPDHVREYQVFLVESKRVSWSTLYVYGRRAIRRSALFGSSTASRLVGRGP